MTDLASLATPLLRATARARSLKDATLVIKLGGSAMEDPTAFDGTLDAVAAIHQLGLRMILVHGGGKAIDRAMTEAGLTPRKILGRRYTDEETLDIVFRVLVKISEDIVAELTGRDVDVENHMGIKASRLQIADASGQLVDLGFVGQPTSVDTDYINAWLNDRFLIVIPSMGQDEHSWLNINADTAASAIAGAIKAEVIYFLTDTVGVLANRNDPSSLLPRLTVAECNKLIADGTIDGGMIPKVEACFEALAAGAKRAVILDGRNPHSLLGEFVSDQILGTEILP